MKKATSTVFLRWDTKGKRWLKSWRGRLEDGGKVREVKLAVKWDGKPPKKGKRHGDKVFEDSRRRAQNELESLVNKGRTHEEELRVAEQIQRLKYGKTNEADTPLDGLFGAWLSAPHSKERGKRWERVAKSSIGTFVSWAKANAKKEQTAGSVSAKTINDYFADRENRGLSGRTRNIDRGILSVVFRSLAPHGEAIKALEGRPKASEDTVHRRALSPEELERLFQAARETGGDWFGDLVVIAACTALRRADAARLRWKNVDLDSGWVEVRPAKNNGAVAVEIPLLAPLRAVLERRRNEAVDGADGESFVVPEAAEMVENNPGGLNWRLCKSISLSGLGSGKLSTTEEIPDGVSRARRPSVLGWHSLRTSWATAAAACGMPLETICEVTGHSSTKTLLKHYVQMDRERKRASVSSRLPGGFMGGTSLSAHSEESDQDWGEVLRIARGLTCRNAKKSKEKLVEIAARNMTLEQLASLVTNDIICVLERTSRRKLLPTSETQQDRVQHGLDFPNVVSDVGD